MRETMRPLVAESIGVFTLVFVGAGVVVTDAAQNNMVGLLGIAVAHGLALAIVVSATLNISGGHINPAITIGLASVGRIGWSRAGLYVLAQLLGAVLAAAAVHQFFPETAIRLTNAGAPRLGPETGMAGGIVIEAILTFFLAFAVMGTAVAETAPKIGGFGIGLVLTMGILACAPLTGAAMNPARAFGPALVANFWMAQLVYWVGPIIGSVLAMQVFERVLKAPPAPPPARGR